MNINQLAKEVHDNAVAHGWWDKPPVLPEALCLIHAELSAALREYQDGAPLIYGTCALAAEDCKFSGVCDRVGRVDVDAVVMAKHKYNLAAQEVEDRRRGNA